ncbi:hypothetical protein L917_20016 [Phytophthora nicotianae]|uniref:Uncharacterized protein n=1 Tax=Phytophthora nicotianae TaxID=4792 RepID=W2K444_PHYNI|nr:hypothetical protein L917_20016 [Phytophthora nicotianae]
MSFLLNDKDQFMTLGEVFAFIDSCDVNDSIDSDTGDVLLDASPTDVGVHKAHKKKKRKRRNLSSSTRLQQGRKAEILFLRRRVLELEEHVHQLQTAPKRRCCLLPQQKPTADGIKTKTKSVWEELAEDHYHARLQSEETNRTLKSILASQIQRSERMCAIVQELSVMQGMDLVCIETPVHHEVYGANHNQVSTLNEFEDTLLHSDWRWIRC